MQRQQHRHSYQGRLYGERVLVDTDAAAAAVAVAVAVAAGLVC